MEDINYEKREENKEYKTVHKWMWVWDFDKEENWLNSMAMQGWVLDKVGFCTYHFQSCIPGEYAVRLEMLEDSMKLKSSSDYIGFIEGTGAEYIGNIVKWAYFRKKITAGGFDLFSDIDSRIRHLDRIIRMLGIVGLLNVTIGAGQIHNLGWINLLCAIILLYGMFRIWKKRTVLTKERALHE